MRKARAPWVIAVAAVATVAAAPVLRQQALGAKTARVVYQALSSGQPGRWGPKPLEPFQARVATFVERHYAADPEMLMAAGLLAPEAKQGLSLLSRAVELGRDPVYHAAYVSRLVEPGPRYARIGAVVADPADAKEAAKAEEQRSSSRVPDRLSPAEAAPVLEALRGWERADPGNGLPHALEAYYLYGLHRDEEAKQAWARAGRLPQAREYVWPARLAGARLLNRMGMVKADALMLFTPGQSDAFFDVLKPAVRYAWYEGRLAEVQGRDGDALRWWNGTVSLGRHLQESADTKAGFMHGVLLERAGGGAAWRAAYDPGQKLFYGPAHAFYAAQVGPEADANLRDDLLRGDARIGLLQGTPGSEPHEPDSPITHATGVQGMAGTMLTLAVWCLVIFALAALLAPRAAEAGARSGWAWAVLIAVTAVVLALVGPTWTLLHPRIIVVAAGRAQAAQAEVSPEALRAGASFVAALLAAVGLPLLLSLRTAANEIGFDGVAWGGNLRRALPVVIAALALSYLALNLTSAKLRAEWLATWTKPGTTALSVQISRIGPEWDRPPLRKDPWAAADPPPGAFISRSQWPF
jgi:hypothetical protein